MTEASAKTNFLALFSTYLPTLASVRGYGAYVHVGNVYVLV